MKSLTEDLIQTNLFSGISEEDAGHLLSCLNARTAEYKQDTIVIEEGSRIRKFGILLSGRGRSYKTDRQGNVITITLLQKGSEIGVLLASSPEQKSPVSVAVEKGSIVLFISYDSLIRNCSRNCPCHRRLIRNFIEIVAGKGLVLHDRSALSRELSNMKKDGIIDFYKSTFHLY